MTGRAIPCSRARSVNSVVLIVEGSALSQKTGDQDTAPRAFPVRQFSGIQPTGTSPHLGNYLGAFRRWAVEQRPEDRFCVVDLHAMTVPYEPQALRSRVLETAAWLMATGIGAGRSCLFVQSSVPFHAELMWLLSCQVQFGDLGRMTQFKEKSQQGKAGTQSSGLFTYPVLMAADILLYRATHVPIGADQSQHLELTRRAVRLMNNLVGEEFFPSPVSSVPTVAARVRDLRDPGQKMSKSTRSDIGTIWMSDDEKTTRKKIMSATTDSVGSVRHAPDEQPGIANLVEILAAVTGSSIEKTVENAPARYGAFKEQVAEAVNAELRPLRQRFAELTGDPELILDELRRGTATAWNDAARVMEELRPRLGMLPVAHPPPVTA